MDIKQLGANLPDPKDPRILSGQLSIYDYYKIKVASKIIKKSMASIGQTALITYLNRNWDQHLERLELEAAQRGISVEELFIKLATED